MKIPRTIFAIPFIASVIVFGTIYVIAQQSIRMAANDPQIEYAEETATILADGIKPSLVDLGPDIDIAQSVSPFVTVYDQSGAVLNTSGYLAGSALKIPAGVFAHASASGE